MVLRVTAKLARKLHTSAETAAPLDANPCADWSANLFLAGRTQYILVSNTATLYSVVMPGRGVTTVEHLREQALVALGECLGEDGLAEAYQRLVVPAWTTLAVAQSSSRAVTGSMVEFVHQARYDLVEFGYPPLVVSHRLNEAPMSYLAYSWPQRMFAATVDPPARPGENACDE